MTDYTIENFWKRRIAQTPVPSRNLICGWSYQPEGLKTFLEAPLKLSTKVESSVPIDESTIILVSAPGAVGKSTLAKQISFECSAIYLDLAEADAVGGNTLSGGIFKCKLGVNWQNSNTAILIDGLDEARLRVTQEAFEAFLRDVASVAENRKVPTVLFGRTGAVQDAYLILSVLSKVDAPILEIGYYGLDAAVNFAMARIRNSKSNRTNESVERNAVTGLINGLRTQTNSDGDRFAGYAPVLQVVADRVAGTANPQALVSEIKKGGEPVRLEDVTSAILKREHGKLSGLSLSDSSLNDRLYKEEEQIHRLAARVYGVEPPPTLMMNPTDARIYDEALKTWVAEHPFIDGGTKPVSAVFDAIISTWAIKNGERNLSDKALQHELGKGVAANPFLSEFYAPEPKAESSSSIPLSHVGILYNSLRARLSVGDSASLTIDSDEEAEDESGLRAEVEISMVRHDKENPRVWKFETDQVSSILLGPHVENVEISARYATVDVGPGTEATFVAPVTIQCAKLQIGTEKVIIEERATNGNPIVFLEADEFVGEKIMSVPMLRGGARLSTSWPGVRAHPWTAFASEPTTIKDPREQEALRRFRKFVITFRAHGKGRLARYQDKIESVRMTKGVGKFVLKALVSRGVLSLSGSMYFLDPQVLTDEVGASFHDCASKQYSDRTLDFIRKILLEHQ